MAARISNLNLILQNLNIPTSFVKILLLKDSRKLGPKTKLSLSYQIFFYRKTRKDIVASHGDY